MSRTAFACIMVMQGDHVTTTILIMCQRTNPDLSQLTLKETGKMGVDTMGIGLEILTSEWGMGNDVFGKGKVLCIIFEVFNFANNIR